MCPDDPAPPFFPGGQPPHLGIDVRMGCAGEAWPPSCRPSIMRPSRVGPHDGRVPIRGGWTAIHLAFMNPHSPPPFSFLAERQQSGRLPSRFVAFWPWCLGPSFALAYGSSISPHFPPDDRPSNHETVRLCCTTDPSPAATSIILASGRRSAVVVRKRRARGRGRR